MNRCYRCEIPLPDAIDGNRSCADCFLKLHSDSYLTLQDLSDLTDPGAAQQAIRQLRALLPQSARSLRKPRKGLSEPAGDSRTRKGS